MCRSVVKSSTREGEEDGRVGQQRVRKSVYVCMYVCVYVTRERDREARRNDE